MKAELLSAHICGSTGKVVALTKRGCYKFKRDVKDVDAILRRLEAAGEIETEYWDLEWELKKAGK